MKSSGYAAILTCVLLLSGSGLLAQQPPSSAAFTNIPARVQKDLTFKQRDFTFVRIRYRSTFGVGRWSIDWPDADNNFSKHFQQQTQLNTDPDGAILDLTDPSLKNFPFIYMAEVGRLDLSDLRPKLCANICSAADSS